jgi:hypothetical protein
MAQTNSSNRAIHLPKQFEILGRVTVPTLPKNRAKGVTRKRMVG